MKKIIFGVLALTFVNFSSAGEKLIFQVKDNSQGDACHDSKFLAIRLIDSNNDGEVEAIETQGAEPAIDLDGKELLVAHYATPKPQREKINHQSNTETGELTLTHYEQSRIVLNFDGDEFPKMLNKRTSYTLSADKKTMRYIRKWDRFDMEDAYARHLDIWLTDDPEPRDGDVDECVYQIFEN